MGFAGKQFHKLLQYCSGAKSLTVTLHSFPFIVLGTIRHQTDIASMQHAEYDGLEWTQWAWVMHMTRPTTMPNKSITNQRFVSICLTLPKGNKSRICHYLQTLSTQGKQHAVQSYHLKMVLCSEAVSFLNLRHSHDRQSTP